MRKLILILLTVSAVGWFDPPDVSAAPIAAYTSVDAAAKDLQPVEQARLFCYNRYNGRFLHWGSCYRRVYRRVYRPRVYCYNRRSGRFLHWGSCRRW